MSPRRSLVALPLALALNGCLLLSPGPVDRRTDPSADPTDPSEITVTDPRGTPSTTGASISCVNPAIARATAPGGGIPGTPQRLDLPAGVSSVRMRVDGNLALLCEPPFDASLYNVRVAAVHLALVRPGGDLELVAYDQKTDAYRVPAGSAVALVPIWQLIAPIDRDVAPGALAVDVDVTW